MDEWIKASSRRNKETGDPVSSALHLEDTLQTVYLLRRDPRNDCHPPGPGSKDLEDVSSLLDYLRHLDLEG